MWKLTIRQAKTFASDGKGYTVEQDISYKSEEIVPLLIQVSNLSKLDTTGNTKYEICEVPKATCTKGEEE